MEAGEALCGEAFAPLADGVPVTIQHVGDLLVGGMVVGPRMQDEATAESQGLRRGTSAEQRLQLLAQIERELNP